MESQTLSHLLENKRKTLLLTQEQFAKILGITQQGYGKWAAGTSTPRPKHMEHVAKVLEISMKEAIQAKINQQHVIQLANSKNASRKDSIEPKEITQVKNISINEKTGNLTGYGLLGIIAAELEKGTLKQHQINTLASIIHSFTIQQ